MFSVEELLAQVNRLKQNRTMVVNNFLPVLELNRLAEEEASVLRYNEKAIVLFCEDNGVNRLHFYLASPFDSPALGELLKDVSCRPLVVDCIGKKEQVEPLSDALSGLGFERYARFSRWRSKEIRLFSEAMLREGMFETSTPQDADELMSLFQQTFDPFDAHFPTSEQLLKDILDGLVFHARDGEKIIAAVCLEKIGKREIYLFLDAVAETHRSSGVGVLLLQYALWHHRDYPSYMTWTNDMNKPSNRMHKALGMSYDGLKDIIMIYR